MDAQKIVVLNPSSKLRDQEVNILNLPASLKGKILGILWNGKLGGDILLNRIGERLKERFNLSEILKIDERSDFQSGLSEEIINELVGKCGLILIGIGD